MYQTQSLKMYGVTTFGLYLPLGMTQSLSYCDQCFAETIVTEITSVAEKRFQGITLLGS